jgi:anti-sigma factor (TIGR02949 family)
MKKRHQHDEERCRELLDQLNDYVDGELAAELCRDLEQHMADCPDCQIVYDTLTKTIRLYHTLDDTTAELPPDVEARLLRRLNLSET